MRSLARRCFFVCLLVATGLSAQTNCPRVLDINTSSAAASSSPNDFADSLGEGVYFSALDGVHGRELWWSDGSANGTVLVKDIRPGPFGSNPSQVTTWWASNRIIRVFAADDGIHGNEVWATDGTTAGTTQLSDILPGAGSSDPQSFVGSGDYVFFIATDSAHGQEVWVTDGTPAGTRILIDLRPGRIGSFPRELTSWQGKVYFAAQDDTYGRELWSSDGTLAGTQLVADIAPGIFSSSPSRFTEFDGKLMFAAEVSHLQGIELWATDGTGMGTQMVFDLTPFPTLSTNPSNLLTFDSHLYFLDGWGASWKSDGTAAGTVPAPFPSPIDWCVSQGKLFFQGPLGLPFLMVTDGTAAGTQQVANTTFPGNMVSAGRGIYFSPSNGPSGSEIYFSDGTVGGTRQVCDVNPGAAGSLSGYLTTSGDKLFFSGLHPTYGAELHVIGEDPAIATILGAACGPGAPTLRASNPIVGADIDLTGTSRASGTAILILGVPAPPVAIPIAAPSCAVWVDLQLPVETVPLPQAGHWSRRFSIPNDPNLLGAALRLQSAQDPLPFSLSNGLHLEFGK